MGKAPAFQFYVADWISDTRHVSVTARGAWMDILCTMWRSPEQGVLSMPLSGFSRLLGTTSEETVAILNELLQMGVCDRDVTRDASVTLGYTDITPTSVTVDDVRITLISRRMSRDAKSRKLAKDRQLRYRSKKRDAKDDAPKTEGNGNVTTHSSSSYSVTKVTDADDGELSVERRVWKDGVDLLMKDGKSSENVVRSFLGKLAKEYGQDLLAEAISVTVAKNPVNPKEFLVGTLKSRSSKPSNDAQRNLPTAEEVKQKQETLRATQTFVDPKEVF